jgi:endonuclease YncB( thermonuclease family)
MKLLAALCLIGISFASHANTSWPEISGEGMVYRVIDGDTLIVNTDSQTYLNLKSHASSDSAKLMNDKHNSFRIRLAAIDTPESVHRDASKNSAAGSEASIFMKKLSGNKMVNFKCWAVEKHGRFLCSAALKETAEDLGLLLIQSGFSTYVTKYGKHPYLHREYLQASK